MPDPDADITIGYVHDAEGQKWRLSRDYDRLCIPAMELGPAGVRELEQVIAEHKNEMARFRLRNLDFEAFDVNLDDARTDLGFYPGLCDKDEPGNLELVDWNEVSRRLTAMRPYGGDAELRKLHALLMADLTPTAEAGRG